MITEDYVSYETAKLLKEKGFDEKCRAFYVKSKECGIELFPVERSHNYNDDVYPRTSAPTLQMAMKWLREVHNMHIEIEAIKPHGRDVLLRSAVPLDGVKYHASIVYIDKWDEDLNEFKWKGIPSSDSYEQACEKTIKYCLENLI